MTNVNLSETEAKLVAVYRAILRFPETDLVGAQDSSLLATYVEALAPTLAEGTSDAIDSYLDGFVAGFGASRLAAAGIDANQIALSHMQVEHGEFQTGIDPTTGEPRH